MKHLLIFLFLLSFLSCQKQSNRYLIVGDIDNIPDNTIIELWIPSIKGGNKIAQDTIINGHFKFSGTLNIGLKKMEIKIRDPRKFSGVCEIWVDYKKIKVSGKTNYLSEWQVNSNIKEQKALNRYKEKTKDVDIKIDSLYHMNSISFYDEKVTSINRILIDSLYQIKRKIEFDIMNDGINSLSGLEKFYKIAKSRKQFSKKQIWKIYDHLDTCYKNTQYGEWIQLILEDKMFPKVGDKMINYPLYDLNGNEHYLTDYIGKYILIDFWSTASGPYHIVRPELKELSSRLSNDLTIIGINLDQNKDLWIEGSSSISWINLSDGKGMYDGISLIFGVKEYPTYILINKEGIIIDRWSVYLKGIFKKVLAEHIDNINF